VLDLAGVNQLRKNWDKIPHQFIQRMTQEEQQRLLEIQPHLLLHCFHFDSQTAEDLSSYRRLFSSLVGSVLVLPSMEDARWYRRLLVKYHMFCPAMLVRQEGKMLTADNIERFDKGATGPNQLQQLPTHFEFRPTDPPERVKAQQKLAACQQLIEQLQPLVAEQELLESKQQALQYDQKAPELAGKQTALQTEVEQLQAEIDQLGGATLAQQAAVAAAPSALAAASAASSSSSSSSSPSSVSAPRSLTRHRAHQEQEHLRSPSAQRLGRKRPSASSSSLPTRSLRSRGAGIDATQERQNKR
jgi:chromosome segregation ATPase